MGGADIGSGGVMVALVGSVGSTEVGGAFVMGDSEGSVDIAV